MNAPKPWWESRTLQALAVIGVGAVLILSGHETWGSVLILAGIPAAGLARASATQPLTRNRRTAGRTDTGGPS
jgi:hypothetical protein